jgi:hypothetical protein
MALRVRLPGGFRIRQWLVFAARHQSDVCDQLDGLAGNGSYGLEILIIVQQRLGGHLR